MFTHIINADRSVIMDGTEDQTVHADVAEAHTN